MTQPQFGQPVVRLEGSPASFNDDISICFGDGDVACIQWDTADPDANHLKIQLPSGGAIDVPVIGVGIGTLGVGLGLFDGLTQPTLAVVDADRDSGVGLTFGDDDAPQMSFFGSASDLRFPDDQALALGSGGDSRIYYDGTDTFWDLQAVGTGGLMIALEGSFPSPDGEAVHIWNGTAGAVTANSKAVLVAESNTDTAIQVLSPDNETGSIDFGFPTAPGYNRLVFFGPSHESVSDTFRAILFNSTRLQWTPNTFQFQEATQIEVTAGDLRLTPATDVRIDGTEGIGDGANTNMQAPAQGTGSGPATLVVDDWIRIKRNDGTQCWLPTFV